MCRIIEGRLNEAITKLQDIIVVQEDNLTRLNDERIREQVQRLQEAADILRTSNEAKIVNMQSVLQEKLVVHQMRTKILTLTTG